MNDLIGALIAWAVANSSYPMPEQPPAVEYRPTAYFAEEVCPRDKGALRLGAITRMAPIKLCCPSLTGMSIS